MKPGKHFLSFLVLAAFTLMALSSTVYKFNMENYDFKHHEEQPKEGNYVELNDGKKIYGQDVGYDPKAFVVDGVTVDGEKYRSSLCKGFLTGHVYFARYGGTFIKRIVHGKINVYVMEETVSVGNGAAYRSHYYAQQGEDGKIKEFYNQNDIKKMVADCPAAVEMLTKSKKEIKEAVNNDSRYYNLVFETYNNDCKQVTE